MIEEPPAVSAVHHFTMMEPTELLGTVSTLVSALGSGSVNCPAREEEEEEVHVTGSSFCLVVYTQTHVSLQMFCMFLAHQPLAYLFECPLGMDQHKLGNHDS